MLCCLLTIKAVGLEHVLLQETLCLLCKFLCSYDIRVLGTSVQV